MAVENSVLAMNGYGFPWCRHPGFRDNGGYAVLQFRGSAGWDKTPCLPSFMSAGEFPEMIRQSYGSCRLRGRGGASQGGAASCCPATIAISQRTGQQNAAPPWFARFAPEIIEHRRLPRVPKCQGISHKPARPGMVALPCLAMRPTSLGGEFRLADGFIFCEAHACSTSQNYSKKLQSLTVQTVPSWFHRFWKTLMPG